MSSATLATYVRTVADMLGLKDWVIEVSDEPADEQYDAFISMRECQKHATLYIGHSYWADSPEEQRHTIVHEMLHPHLDQMQRLIERNSEVFGSVPAAILIGQHKVDLEFATDAIAAAISQHFPLPPVHARK